LPNGVVGVGGPAITLHREEETAELQEDVTPIPYFSIFALPTGNGKNCAGSAPRAHDPIPRQSPALRRKFRCHCGRLRTGRRSATPAEVAKTVASIRAIIDSGGRFRQ